MKAGKYLRKSPQHPRKQSEIKRKEEVERRRLPIPGWLFVALMVVFLELMVHIWTVETIVWGRLATVTAFAAAFGAVLALLISFLPPTAGKWTALAVSLILTVVYMVEYFVNDSYMCFMPLTTVIAGAGGVATDFISVIFGLLAQEYWRIIVVLLPSVLYAVLCRYEKRTWKWSAVLAGAAAALYLLSFGLVKWVGIDASKLTTTYNFDSSVRAFGIHVSLVMDAVRGSEGAEEDLAFVTPVTTTPTTQPTEATEPENTEDTQPTEEVTEPPVVYGQNALDIDFAALAESEQRNSIASIHSYVASLTPSSQNEYTGLFEGKNLILITAEAFSAEVIDPELTPTLYRLSTEGIHFTDYYQPQWGGSTSTGEFSVMTGLVAANGISSVNEGRQQDMFLTMGRQLQKQGYTSFAFHNHTYSYYDRHKTHAALGYDTYMGLGNGLEAGVKKVWPESDLEMMEYTVDMYIDKQPFSIYYMTVSGHCLYNNLGGNAMSSKNYDLVPDNGYSETIKCYLAAQLELEHALTYLVQRLEAAGIMDDTVIVLSTDHYPYGLEKSSTWNNTKDYLSELYGYKYSNVFERDHSALIIWSGCIEDMDLVVDTPTYSLDILPTLSNLFGVPYDSRLLVGRDVFSDEPALVLWPDFNWKTEFGYFNADTDEFIPAEGAEVDSEYVEYITAVVANKINFSKLVQNNDYYDYLIPYLAE